MGNCYSVGHIAEVHLHTDITCNVEERSVIDYCGPTADVIRTFCNGTCVTFVNNRPSIKCFV